MERIALQKLIDWNNNKRKRQYYSERNGEIDFVIQYGTSIIPVEAKGGEDKSAPTFKKYVSEHKPEYAMRFSKRGYKSAKSRNVADFFT